MDLTEVSIRQLKSKPERSAVTDSRGLSIEVFPSGSKYWRYRYRVNGKNEKMALGRYSTIGLKAARMRRDDAARVVANGDSPATQKQRQKYVLDGEVTIKNFGERYYSEIVMKDRKTRSRMAFGLRKRERSARDTAVDRKEAGYGRCLMTVAVCSSAGKGSTQLGL